MTSIVYAKSARTRRDGSQGKRGLGDDGVADALGG